MDININMIIIIHSISLSLAYTHSLSLSLSVSLILSLTLSHTLCLSIFLTLFLSSLSLFPSLPLCPFYKIWLYWSQSPFIYYLLFIIYFILYFDLVALKQFMLCLWRGLLIRSTASPYFVSHHRLEYHII